MIDWDNGEQCLTGGTNDPFWDRKLYNKLMRSRKSKKVANQNLIKRKKTLALFRCKYIIVNMLL